MHKHSGDSKVEIKKSEIAFKTELFSSGKWQQNWPTMNNDEYNNMEYSQTLHVEIII